MTHLQVPYNAKTYELLNSIVWLDSDGILYSRPRDAKFINGTRAQMEEDLKRFREITGGKKVCMIAELHPYAEAPNKADRDYVSEKLAEVTKALAIISGSPLSKMVANLFFLFKPAPYPMRMFNNLDEAKRWLTSEKVRTRSTLI